MGAYDGERLVFAGRVGTGFDDATLAALRAGSTALERKESPFDTLPHVTGHVLHWIEPAMVIEVAFREWTAEGHLRQPVFLGVREDKSPTEVIREVAEKDAAPSENAGGLPSPEATADAAQPAAASEPAPDAASTKPIAVLGVRVTNPGKRLFPESAFTKADFANYYAAIAPLMLAETADRPLTLVRCPVGHGRDCFYQRHPDKGLSEHIHTLDHTLKGEPVKLLTVDSAEGLVALAQMGAVEVHTWLSRIDAPTRPDRIVFDLDPGEDVGWPQIRMTALLVAEECRTLGFEAFLKSTGSKGLHVVLPIEPVWEFTRIRALAKALADRIASRHPDALTTLMAKSQRGGRVFFDYLRNAEGASAVAAYSTRKLTGPPCALPLALGRAHRRPRHPRVHARARVSSGRRPESIRGLSCRDMPPGRRFCATPRSPSPARLRCPSSTPRGRALRQLADLGRGLLGEFAAHDQVQRVHQVVGHPVEVALVERVRCLADPLALDVDRHRRQHRSDDGAQRLFDAHARVR